MKELTFLVTRHCNWSCNYCSIKSNDAEAKSEELVRAFRATLHSYAKENQLCINLSGGEPGLLDKATVKELLDTIVALGVPAHLNIFTNGTAFWIDRIMQKHMREYSPVIKSYRFIWHCVSSIKQLKQVKIPRRMAGRVFPVAVITNADIPFLDDFLTKNRRTAITFAIHNHCYKREKLGVHNLDQITECLEAHYGSFSLRSLEIPSFIIKPGNPDLDTHRAYCSKHLAATHHVYDISSGRALPYKCCIALTAPGGIPDCASCVNYQQFYENALSSCGYTQPLPGTN